MFKTYIGEAFINESSYWGPFTIWRKFTKKQILDKTPERYKIKFEYSTEWVKREDIFFYDDMYKPLRKKIEKLNSKDLKRISKGGKIHAIYKTKF